MKSRWQTEKEQVVQACLEMARRGLVVGSAGNISVRLGDAELVAITPRGKDYELLTADQVQVVDFEAEPIEGDQVPSVETMMHVAVYRARPDIRAVAHTHSVYASALAVAHLPLPPVVDELIMSVGGEVPVTEYAFPSSEELAAKVAEALRERNAALMANHGVVGVGATPREALAVCELVERAAHIYVVARALGQAHPLPDDVIATEQDLFRMMHLKASHAQS